MHLNRITRLAMTLAATAVLGWPLATLAQTYPTRPIALGVAFSAGGPSDSIARILADRMGRALGQPVVVENVTGAGGTIGVGKVVRAAPDGYTLGIGHNGTHVINGALYPLPYDLVKDLAPVSLVAANPQMIIVNPGMPVKNVRELLAWVKENQNRLNIGTGGIGTPSHLMAEYFIRNVAKMPLQMAHYRGSAPALVDIVAGHTHLQFDQAASSLPLYRAGKIRALAVTSATRMAAAPELPSVDEAGMPGFYMSVWHGIWAPKDTPRPVVARIDAAIVESLADPALRQRLADLGQEIPPREQQNPDGLAAQQKAEIDKWWPLIKAAGIKAE
jgi:tripartite-type tricarboxylate transporter receptor subunit TctC